MGTDRKFLVGALGYAVAGTGPGVFMGASKDHGQYVTHARILLAGFVASLVYAIIHRLWLERPPARLAAAQFRLHQLAALAMTGGLFVLYGGFASERTVGPLLGLASLGVLAAMLLMLLMVLRSPVRARTAR